MRRRPASVYRKAQQNRARSARTRVVWITTLAVLILGTGIALQIIKPLPKIDPARWINEPHDQWPQMVLTNDAEFNGHTPLYGASAFLVVNTKGTVLAVTAKHLIGTHGGVDPEIDAYDLNSVLRRWELFPRTQSKRRLGVSGLPPTTGTPLHHSNVDVLVLALKYSDELLPAEPIAVRHSPVRVGERVYLVGVLYSEPNSPQNVYTGQVVERVGDRFRYSIEPPVDLRGFSGAPILDRNGHVVGVMTVWFARENPSAKDPYGGGEDIRAVRRTIEG